MLQTMAYAQYMFILVVKLNSAKCRLPKGPKFVFKFWGPRGGKSQGGGGEDFFSFKQGGGGGLALDDTMLCMTYYWKKVYCKLSVFFFK